jgi:hypothetical protein
MVRKPSEQLQACFDRALNARRKADRTADPALRADFLEMETRWLVLAKSYVSQISPRKMLTGDGGSTNRGVSGRDRTTSRDCKSSFRKVTSRPSLSACGFLR